MRKAGLWIDQRKAIIVPTEAGMNSVVITSEIEEGHVHGGYGGAQKHLPQDSVSDTKILERREHQTMNFFKEVIGSVIAMEQLYVMGPGETRKRLVKQLEHTSGVKTRVVANEPADSMTDGQLIARVKAFYGE